MKLAEIIRKLYQHFNNLVKEKNMKNIYLVIIVLSCAMVITSCKKTINEKQLQIRNDLAYEVNSEEPYTGEVLDYYDSENKQMKFRVNYTKGKMDGIVTFYHKNGNKSEEYKYENGKEIEGRSWYESGQLMGERAYSGGKVIKMSSYLDNGQKEFSFDNDTHKDFTKFEFLNAKNEIDRTAYYLNSKIIPMMSFIEMNGKSPDEIIQKFGKVEAEGSQKDVMVTYIYRFYRAENGSSVLKNKAVVTYSFFKSKDGSIDPIPVPGQIVYYNITEQEKMEIMTEADKYLLANGFLETKKNEFKGDKFSLSKIELYNNISYSFYMNMEK